jgi:tetratricopeptide (TPR) repeat protein
LRLPGIAAARRALALALAASVGLVVGAPAQARAETSWATAQAVEMTRQGQEHATHGDASVGARRFLDAINFDPTYAPAYLALGQLYEASGDPVEAERAYSMGIDHVARWADGLRARARLRARLGRPAESVGDLEAAADAAPDDPALLVELEEAYVSTRSLVAALAVARRREALAARHADRGALSDARVRVRALALLVGEVDPVTAGERDRGLVRSALARLARRR